jgi:hypothetical protein
MWVQKLFAMRFQIANRLLRDRSTDPEKISRLRMKPWYISWSLDHYYQRSPPQQSLRIYAQVRSNTSYMWMKDANRTWVHTWPSPTVSAYKLNKTIKIPAVTTHKANQSAQRANYRLHEPHLAVGIKPSVNTALHVIAFGIRIIGWKRYEP